MTELPRLLYVADMAIEPTRGGEAALHRLLSEYPAERLRVVVGDLAPTTGRPEDRLPAVRYHSLRVGRSRLLKTRLSQIYSAYLSITARRRVGRALGLARDFEAEGIVSLTHGFSWITAAALAERLRIPLHLIVHDDWLLTRVLPGPMRAWANRTLGRVYRQAKSRLCVCPSMVQEYERRYGVRGSVLYPSRAPGSVVFDAPPARLKAPGTPPVLGYAGSLHLTGYADGIRLAAVAMERIGGKVIVYCSMSGTDKHRLGLDRPNIDVRDFLPSSNQLIEALRNEATALLVPMTFQPEYRDSTEFSFPSKLTDYTAAGLPLLIWGPEHASVVRWAKENALTAEVVETPDLPAMEAAVRRLTDPEHRQRLAIGAVAIGNRFFSPETSKRHFWNAVTSGVDPEPSSGRAQ